MSGPIVLATTFGAAPFPAEHEPWCEPGDIADCVANPGSIDVESVCRGASAILRALSGRRFGVRRITVRPSGAEPCGPTVPPTPSGSWLVPAGGPGWAFSPRGMLLDAPASVLEIVVDGRYLNPGFADGAITAGQTGITSGHAVFTAADVGKAIAGPGIPAGTTITAVSTASSATMSAAAIVTTTTPFVIGRTPEWYLYDRRLLIRANGATWPGLQDLSMPLTEAGTWGITYESGVAVPAEGRLAAVALSCELLKLLVKATTGTGECAIPDRVSAVTRQGVSWSLDAQGFLDDGRTGVWVADLWLESLLVSRKRRRASIASPETVREARL